MKLIYTNSFKKEYQKLSIPLQNKTDKKLKILVENINHPSLRVKKIQKYRDVLEATINKNYRLLFQITSDGFIFLRIGKHDILER